MKPGMTILEFMDDEVLLPDRPFSGGSWATWRVALKGIFALQMTRNERRVFKRIAGRRAPSKPVVESWSLVGRRGGKTRVAAVIAVYLALSADLSRLSPGERGHVLLLAVDKAQARVAFDYAVGIFRSSEMLSQLLDGDPTAEEIRLTNGVVIGVHANNFRSIRGRSLLGAVLEDTAFWRD